MHVHDKNLQFHLISKVLYWIEIWWLWRPLKYNERIFMFKKPSWDHLSCVTWCSILLEMLHLVHKGMNAISNSTAVLNNTKLVSSDPQCAKKITPTSLHYRQLPELLIQGRMDPCFHVVHTKFYHLKIWMLQLKWTHHMSLKSRLSKDFYFILIYFMYFHKLLI